MKIEVGISLVGTIAAVLAVMQATHAFKQGIEQYTATNSYLVRSDIEAQVFDLLIFVSGQSEETFDSQVFAARMMSTNAALSRAHELKLNGGVTPQDWNSFMSTICPELEVAAFLRVSTLEVYLSEFEKLCEDF